MIAEAGAPQNGPEDSLEEYNKAHSGMMPCEEYFPQALAIQRLTCRRARCRTRTSRCRSDTGGSRNASSGSWLVASKQMGSAAEAAWIRERTLARITKAAGEPGSGCGESDRVREESFIF